MMPVIPPDRFFDIKDRERARDNSLEESIRTADSRVALARSLASLAGVPAYQDFHKELKAARDRTMREMVSCGDSNDTLRMLQGRLQAYDSILGVVERANAQLKVLTEDAQRLHDLQPARR